jgi:hypothetical protein
LPRKYRPPAAKRRKNRRNIPYEGDVSVAEPAETGDSTITFESEAAPAVAVDVADVPPEPEDRPVRQSRSTAERHVSRDYSYVRGEVLRLVAIAVCIMVAMAITSFFR